MAFANCQLLTGSIVIPNGVIELGEYSFYSCRALSSVSIPDGLKKIGSYAFWNAFISEGLRVGTDRSTDIWLPISVEDIGFRSFDFESTSPLTVHIPSGCLICERSPKTDWCESDATISTIRSTGCKYCDGQSFPSTDVSYQFYGDMPPPSPPPPPPLRPAGSGCVLTLAQPPFCPASDGCRFREHRTEVQGTAYETSTYVEVSAEVDLGPVTAGTTAGTESSTTSSSTTTVEQEIAFTLDHLQYYCRYVVFDLYAFANRNSLREGEGWCSHQVISSGTLVSGAASKACILMDEHIGMKPCRADYTAAKCAPGGSTLGSTNDGGCFPSSATTRLANGTSVRLDMLKEGDTVLSATADGVLINDTISLFSLADTTAKATFIALKTDAETVLTLTPAHHLPVGPKCCSDIKNARNVAVGDMVWALSAGTIHMQTVVAKTTVASHGLFSPVLTNGNYPIVDGFITSFDNARSVALAAHFLKYMLPLCKATSSCDILRHTLFPAERKYIT